ncbi:putative alpha-L-fucosidase [Helianthus annuus]|nr:putative alpha-L-fucosidase [Helianthus annuus]KAJ0697962.1 putative alpha-L-fucosidase [Helianthus annuus]KAJ0701331.1 putative alpha-L-fucosidase [Helianthus annuus]
MELICKLLVYVTLLFPISILSLQECNFPAVFNVGDSGSDTGALLSMFGEPAAPPPNGETFFHSSAGRVCDGRLLIDFIAEGVGVPYLSAFLDSMGTNFTHGANFATVGSTIRRQNTTIFQSGYSPISLDIQYAQFSNFLKRSQIIRRKGTHSCLANRSDLYTSCVKCNNTFPVIGAGGVFKNLFPEEFKFSSALYTFDIGHNDLTAGYQLNMSPGFVDPFLVCCGHGGKYNFNIAMRCGWTKMVNGTKTMIAKSCEDPSSRIMWDGLHFTEVANRWIYNQIADGAYSDPPIPLKTACHRMI